MPALFVCDIQVAVISGVFEISLFLDVWFGQGQHLNVVAQLIAEAPYNRAHEFVVRKVYEIADLFVDIHYIPIGRGAVYSVLLFGKKNLDGLGGYGHIHVALSIRILVYAPARLTGRRWSALKIDGRYNSKNEKVLLHALANAGGVYREFEMLLVSESSHSRHNNPSAVVSVREAEKFVRRYHFV